MPNTVHVRVLYARYLRDEIPLVGFARDVICGRIQQLWPAQKLFSVFVEISGYQNGLAFIWYRLYGKIYTSTSSLRLEKRALGKLQQSMLTNVWAQHRSKPCFALYRLLWVRRTNFPVAAVECRSWHIEAMLIVKSLIGSTSVPYCKNCFCTEWSDPVILPYLLDYTPPSNKRPPPSSGAKLLRRVFIS